VQRIIQGRNYIRDRKIARAQAPLRTGGKNSWPGHVKNWLSAPQASCAMVSTSISASEFRPGGELHPQRDDRGAAIENGMLGMDISYEGEEIRT